MQTGDRREALAGSLATGPRTGIISDWLGEDVAAACRLVSLAAGSDRRGGSPRARAGDQQPKTYPHAQIPAARLIFVFRCCFCVFLRGCGNLEVGGGDNCYGFQARRLCREVRSSGPKDRSAASPRRQPLCLGRKSREDAITLFNALGLRFRRPRTRDMASLSCLYIVNPSGLRLSWVCGPSDPGRVPECKHPRSSAVALHDLAAQISVEIAHETTAGTKPCKGGAVRGAVRGAVCEGWTSPVALRR